MGEPMQPFIVEALRVITERLFASTDQAPDSKLVTVANEQFLDVSMADTVNDGSFIFSNPEGNSDPDWCVLALQSNNLDVFRIRGRLRAGMKAEEFVAKAYQLILMRTVGEMGRRMYPALLEKSVVTKRDVLKILLESPEAKILDVKFVIVPEPSSWLSRLGVIPGDDSSFPPLVVRKRE